jgi:hypothetical protein
MSTRYATIIVNSDGEDEISNISQMEGAAPDVRSGTAKVEKVADGVLIGMVRNGPVQAVGKWGFPEGYGAVRSPATKAEAKGEPKPKTEKPAA